MPIDPNAIQYLPIASIAPDTLKLVMDSFAQGTGLISGLILAAIFAMTWRG